MLYRFPFWYRHNMGFVEVFPAHAWIEYNGKRVSQDEVIDPELNRAIFTARMQRRGIIVNI